MRCRGWEAAAQISLIMLSHQEDVLGGESVSDQSDMALLKPCENPPPKKQRTKVNKKLNWEDVPSYGPLTKVSVPGARHAKALMP